MNKRDKIKAWGILKRIQSLLDELTELFYREYPGIDERDFKRDTSLEQERVDLYLELQTAIREYLQVIEKYEKIPN